MKEILLSLSSGLWLGILTSISPCPLATNIAAISYIAKRIDKPRIAALSGLLYAIGRSLVYVAIAVPVIAGVFAVPALSNFLQKYFNKILGPVIILTGMILLELIKIPVKGKELSDGIIKRADALGVWGAGFLGIVFALAFCPTSAALFFGGLIPLALRHKSPVVLPLLYGLGTAIPTVAFGVVIAFGSKSLGTLFKNTEKFEKIARIVTGIIFILIGIYITMKYIFNIIN